MRNSDPMWLNLKELHEFLKINHDYFFSTDSFDEIYRIKNSFYTCYFINKQLVSIGHRTKSHNNPISNLTGPAVVDELGHHFSIYKSGAMSQDQWEVHPLVIEAKVNVLIKEVLGERR